MRAALETELSREAGLRARKAWIVAGPAAQRAYARSTDAWGRDVRLGN
jgi:hypothetical protein